MKAYYYIELGCVDSLLITCNYFHPCALMHEFVHIERELIRRQLAGWD